MGVFLAQPQLAWYLKAENVITDKSKIDSIQINVLKKYPINIYKLLNDLSADYLFVMLERSISPYIWNDNKL